MRWTHHKVFMILRLSTANENLLLERHFWARIPGTARILRALAKPRARKMRAVPGILADEWRKSIKFSFAVETRRIMEALWSTLKSVLTTVSMNLRLSTANENSRRGDRQVARPW